MDVIYSFLNILVIFPNVWKSFRLQISSGKSGVLVMYVEAEKCFGKEFSQITFFKSPIMYTIKVFPVIDLLENELIA